MVFDDLFIRHWDTWRQPGKVWTLGHADLATGEFENLLEMEYTQRMDPILDFTVKRDLLAFTIKAPHLDDASHTRLDVYTLDASLKPTHLTPYPHGEIKSLTFDPQSDDIAWLQMETDGYESDLRRLMVYHDGQMTNWTGDIEERLMSVIWGDHGLCLTAEHHGRILPYHISRPGGKLKPLGNEGSTKSITPLNDGATLLAIESFTSVRNLFLSDTNGVHPLTHWGEDLKDRLSQPEEFWFKGTDDLDIMAWITKPRDFQADSVKTYPMAFCIHGGPQMAWWDEWYQDWHTGTFASAGYFVVEIQYSGSSGYGQDFIDRITGQWANRPFKDLLAGYHAVLKAFPEIDRDRTAALGFSFGGYMVNWIQSHNHNFGFKAIVCHDGIFDLTSTFYSTEELWYMTHDLEGTPVTNPSLYEKWNPREFVKKWSTPELVIHGGKDFRLTEDQGVMAFTALQMQGVPSRYVYYPGEPHMGFSARNQLHWYHRVFDWLEQWIGKADAETNQDGTAERKSESHADDKAFVLQ